MTEKLELVRRRLDEWEIDLVFLEEVGVWNPEFPREADEVMAHWNWKREKMEKGDVLVWWRRDHDEIKSRRIGESAVSATWRGLTLVGIHAPPNGNGENYKKFMSEVARSLDKGGKGFVVGGDFNAMEGRGDGRDQALDEWLEDIEWNECVVEPQDAPSWRRSEGGQQSRIDRLFENALGVQIQAEFSKWYPCSDHRAILATIEIEGNDDRNGAREQNGAEGKKMRMRFDEKDEEKMKKYRDWMLEWLAERKKRGEKTTPGDLEGKMVEAIGELFGWRKLGADGVDRIRKRWECEKRTTRNRVQKIIADIDELETESGLQRIKDRAGKKLSEEEKALLKWDEFTAIDWKDEDKVGKIGRWRMRARRIQAKLFKKENEAIWKRRVQTLQSRGIKNPEEISRLIKKKKKTEFEGFLDQDGKVKLGDEGKQIAVEKWKQQWGNDCAPKPLPERFGDGEVRGRIFPSVLSDEKAKSPFSMEEAQLALFSLNKTSAPGRSGITPPMILALGDPALEVYLEYINEMWVDGKTSKFWREINARMLHKGGEVKDPSNYRPISLVETGQKIIGTMIKNRLERALEKGWSAAQRGFRKGKSTAEHLMAVTAVLQARKLSGAGPFEMAFLDISKAFDSPPLWALNRILEEMGLPESPRNAILTLQRNSEMTLLFGDEETGSFEAKSGFRQGDPLSPLLFNLVLDPILKFWEWKFHGFDEAGVRWKVAAFADDICIGSSKNELREMLRVFIEYGDWCGLKMNAKKSAVWAEGVADKSPYEGILISDDPYKYLGIVLDSKLRFEKEKDLILKNVALDVSTISRLHFLDIQQKVWIANAIAISKLRYHSQAAVLDDKTLKAIGWKIEKAVIKGHLMVSENERAQLFAPKSKGGLGMFEPVRMAKAAALNAVVRFKKKMDEEGQGGDFQELAWTGKKAEKTNPAMLPSLAIAGTIAADLGIQPEFKGWREKSWDELVEEAKLDKESVDKIRLRFPQPSMLFGVKRRLGKESATALDGAVLKGVSALDYNRLNKRAIRGITKEVNAVIWQIKGVPHGVDLFVQRKLEAPRRMKSVKKERRRRPFCLIATDGSKGVDRNQKCVFSGAFFDQFSGIRDEGLLEDCRSIEQAEWRALIQALAAAPKLKGQRPAKVIFAIDRKAVADEMRLAREPDIPEGRVAKRLAREWEEEGFELEYKHIYSHQERVEVGEDRGKRERMRAENGATWQQMGILDEVKEMNEEVDRRAGSAIANQGSSKVWKRDWSEDEIVTLVRGEKELKRISVIAERDWGDEPVGVPASWLRNLESRLSFEEVGFFRRVVEGRIRVFCGDLRFFSGEQARRLHANNPEVEKFWKSEHCWRCQNLVPESRRDVDCKDSMAHRLWECRRIGTRGWMKGLRGISQRRLEEVIEANRGKPSRFVKGEWMGIFGRTEKERDVYCEVMATCVRRLMELQEEDTQMAVEVRKRWLIRKGAALAQNGRELELLATQAAEARYELDRLGRKMKLVQQQEEESRKGRDEKARQRRLEMEEAEKREDENRKSRILNLEMGQMISLLEAAPEVRKDAEELEKLRQLQRRKEREAERKKKRRQRLAVRIGGNGDRPARRGNWGEDGRMEIDVQKRAEEQRKERPESQEGNQRAGAGRKEAEVGRDGRNGVRGGVGADSRMVESGAGEGQEQGGGGNEESVGGGRRADNEVGHQRRPD